MLVFSANNSNFATHKLHMINLTKRSSMKTHLTTYLQQYFLFIVIGLLLVKTTVGFWNANVDLKRMDTQFTGKFKHSFTEGLNIDEYEMARSAFYYLQTSDFVCDNHFGRPNFTNTAAQTSAFRPKFNIMLHVAGLQIYQAATQQSISTAEAIPQDYFGYYGLLIAILKTIFFAISVFYFHRLAYFIFEDNWAKIATILYITYPSLFLYMGWLDILENLALPLLVIIVSYIVVPFNTTNAPKFKKQWFFIAAIAAVTCLLRPHVLAIFQLLIPVYSLFFVWHVIKKSQAPHNWRLVTLMYTAIFLVHLPIFWQNYRDFGTFMLSSQPGLEFFQGHNDYARGTWNPYLWEQHLNDFQVITAAKNTLANYNEKQELDFYFQTAKEWITQNPVRELWLIVRKTAIYFFPYNYLHQHINFFTLFIHIGFIGFVLFLFLDKPWRARFNDITHTHTWMWISIPIVASYGLSVAFFVCERWRIYAEPFLLLTALYFYRTIWFKCKPLILNVYYQRTNKVPQKTETMVTQLQFSHRIYRWLTLNKLRIVKS